MHSDEGSRCRLRHQALQGPPEQTDTQSNCRACRYPEPSTCFAKQIDTEVGQNDQPGECVRGLCRSSDGREGERGGEREGGREGEREREREGEREGGRKKEREGGRREGNRLCWLFCSLSIRCMCACVTDNSV